MKRESKRVSRLLSGVANALRARLADDVEVTIVLRHQSDPSCWVVFGNDDLVHELVSAELEEIESLSRGTPS